MIKNLECDFCAEPGVISTDLTIIPVKPFSVPGLMINTSWGWGACPTCAPLLQACVESVGASSTDVDWTISALVDHAVRAQQERQPGDDEKVMRSRFRIVYLSLLIHQSGPLRKWDPALDEVGT